MGDDPAVLTHLQKAQQALDDCGNMEVELTADTLPKVFYRLIDLARVQAEVAQAEALTRLADTIADECKIGGAFEALRMLTERVNGDPVLQSIAWSLDRIQEQGRA